MEPTLSVLITYHNEKELLRECLESLFSQKQPPEEVLIFDDASVHSPKDHIPASIPVKVLRSEKNVGPSVGRNALLEQCKTDFLHFHDADDWFQPTWSEKVRAVLSSNTVDAVYTEVASYNESKESVSQQVLGLSAVTDSDSLIRFCIESFMLVPAGTFRTALAKELGGYRTNLWQSEDFDFNIRLALNKPRFHCIQEALVGIRLRQASRSRNQIETNTYALEALKHLEKEVPVAFHNAIAEKAAQIGASLFRLQDKAKAREAFQMAQRLGPPRFAKETAAYKLLAHMLGQEKAETFGQLYRSSVPKNLRSWIRS